MFSFILPVLPLHEIRAARGHWIESRFPVLLFHQVSLVLSLFVFDPLGNLLEYGHKFDFLFLQFYNNYCYPGSQYFLSVLNTWLNWARNIANEPLIMVGLPAGLGAAGSPDYNFPPDQLAVAYKVINALTAVGALDFTRQWGTPWQLKG